MEAAPRDVADWFWTPSWQQVPLAAGSSGEDGGWLIFLDETGLGERLAERLRGEGRVVATARRAADLDYAALLQGASNVVHLWGVTAGEPAPREALEAGLLSLVRLSQAVTSPVHVTVVANGLHEVADGDPVHPAKATVLGVLKVLHQEVPSLSCACVDVGQPSDRRVDQILAEARRGAAAGGSVVALRGRQRWVRDFAPVSLPDHAPVAPGGAYLVTDGQHGAALADYLVNQLAARVAMAGEARPGVVSLPPGEPAAVLAAARAALGTIDGVFHTGGAFTGGLVQLKTAESLLASIEPATRDAEAWLAAADALTERPGFVLLMSSTLAFTGGLGQLDLAVTGAFLDALAQRQAAGGRTRTLAVHWDPYQWHGWLVAAAGGLAGLQPEEVEKSLDAWGTPSEKSGDALLRLLASGLPRAVVSSREIHGLIAEADAVTAETFLAQVGTLHGNSVGAGGEKAARPALSTPYVAPRNEREATLAALWEELFGIASVGVDDSFLELGGHSLLAIQMVTQIRNRLAAELPVTALFESPTVAELAKAVGRAKGEESEEDLAALLALVEGLSPEEAAERLAALEVSSWVPPPVPRVTSPSAAGDWPLSIDQERLWRLHRDNPALVSWNVDAASRLRGDLDASLLAAALREVVRRHAALRASFPLVDGRPVQRVAAEMAAPLGLIDLKALPEGAREGEAHRALFDRTRQVFDLEHGPLVRAALVRLDPRDHLFLLTLHHTATDWITIQLVMQELMALYEVARAGLPSPLSEPERQFPDFAVWERRWWSGGVLAESADFWRRELAGFPLVLDLPADRPRPAVQSQRGGMIPFSAGPEGSRRLRDLARREAVTPFMANLALVDALLFRLTGRDKLVVGSNSANRPRPELEAVAGFFLTQVPFAVDLAGDPTFRELLARVKKASLAAYSRPSMPFDRLIEAVAPEAAADSSRFPLVQVLLLVLEGKSHVDAGSLGSTAVPLYDGNSRWDLLFGFYNYEDLGLTGSVEYNADILDGTTVESWLRLLRRILEKVTADPGTRLSQLPGVDTEGPA